MVGTPEVGAPFSWAPTAWTDHGLGLAATLGAATRVHGRIVYVHEEHRYFRVEARCDGGVIRECFKF